MSLYLRAGIRGDMDNVMSAKDIVAAADAKLAGMFPNSGRMTPDQMTGFKKLVDE